MKSVRRCFPVCSRTHALTGASLLLLVTTLTAGSGCTGQVEDAGPRGTGSGSHSGTGAAPGGTGSVNGGTGSIGAPGGTGTVPGGTGGTGTPADPTAAGTRPLRLLTTREYLNTVRDLLGDSSLTAAALPTEDEDPHSAFAFKAAGTVATLDATLYRDAAEALAKSAATRFTTLLPCAASASGTAGEAACLNTFMTTLAVKMYRRPLAAADVTRLTDVFNTGKTTLALNFSGAIAFVIEVVLQSPEFLYHWEVDPIAAVKEGAVVKLGNYELANRLSYFLWGTMPDDALFGAAKAGQLGDAAAVDVQVRRMLKDGKASNTFADFFVDWLDLDALPQKPKDPQLYMNYDEALTTAMITEVRSFVSGVVTNANAKFDEFLTGTNSFANQSLASVYGLMGVTGTAFRAVTLNPQQRAGVLTSAAFMSVTGGTAGSNPPLRGKAVLYKLLCRTLPPVPANVPMPKPITPGVTTRQRFEEHSMNPCATACHELLDPLGFAFENYDGIGQYRTTDNNQPVNASVTLKLDNQTQTVTGGPGLMGALVASDEVQTCFAKQWLRYAVGRMDSPEDVASVNGAVATFKTANRDVRELIVGLSTSRTFRYRTPAAGEVLQ